MKGFIWVAPVACNEQARNDPPTGGMNMKFETEQEAYEAYDEYLDEQPDVIIGSLSYAPSRVLKLVDPTAYRCGFSDFMDWNEIKEDE